MKKVFAFTLVLVALSLLIIPAQARETPVVVKRVKNVCFIFAKADHHARKFSVHYDNLSPNSQALHAEFKVQGGLGFTIDTIIIEGGSMEAGATGDYGITMSFKIEVDGDKILEDRIVIPPPRAQEKIRGFNAISSESLSLHRKLPFFIFSYINNILS